MEVNQQVWLTVDGSLIRRKYALRGGSVGAFEGKILGRKKHLELLENQIDKLQAETSQVKSIIQHIQQNQENLRSENKQKLIKS